MTDNLQTVNLNLLEHSWTAEVTLNNGQKVTIWWTAWASSKRGIKSVNSVSSDFPKFLIADSESRKCCKSKFA